MILCCPCSALFCYRWNAKWKEWQAYLTSDDETSSELKPMKANKGSAVEQPSEWISPASQALPNPWHSSRQCKLWTFFMRAFPALGPSSSAHNWQPFCFVKSSLNEEKKCHQRGKRQARKKKDWKGEENERQSECHDNWKALHYEMEFHKRPIPVSRSGRSRSSFVFRRVVGGD